MEHPNSKKANKGPQGAFYSKIIIVNPCKIRIICFHDNQPKMKGLIEGTESNLNTANLKLFHPVGKFMSLISGSLFILKS